VSDESSSILVAGKSQGPTYQRSVPEPPDSAPISTDGRCAHVLFLGRISKATTTLAVASVIPVSFSPSSTQFLLRLAEERCAVDWDLHTCTSRLGVQQLDMNRITSKSPCREVQPGPSPLMLVDNRLCRSHRSKIFFIV